MKQQAIDFLERHGVTPAKGALIGVLLMGLVIVVAVQVWRFRSPEIAIPEPTRRPRPAITPVNSAESSSTPDDAKISAVRLDTPQAPAESRELATPAPHDDTVPSVATELEPSHTPPMGRVPIAQTLRRDPFTRPLMHGSVDDASNDPDEGPDGDDRRVSVSVSGSTTTPTVVPVQRIVIGPSGAAVLIDGNWFFPGDRWGDYRIHAIQEDGVVLEQDTTR